MSYIIPPRLKSQDYKKGVLTQDELLRIAIANDANISAARKAVKMGEVQQLTPTQSASADELLGDLGKQESDARTNLKKLGFRDQEMATIIGSLINEQDVLRALNINFPAIEADIKRRFDVKLLTPTFFLNYLREYNSALQASRGLDVNSSASVRRPNNAFINNLEELKSLLPKPEVIAYIIEVASSARIVTENTILRLQNIEDWIRYAMSVGSQRVGTTQYNEIQNILDNLSDLPSKEVIVRLYDDLKNGMNPQRMDVIRRIQSLASSAPTTTPPSQRQASPTEGEKAEEIPMASATVLSADEIISLPITKIRETIKNMLDVKDRLRATKNVAEYEQNNKIYYAYKKGDKVNPIYLTKNPENVSFGKKYILIEDTNLRELLVTKYGRGISSLGFGNKPKSIIKIGRGLAVKETPTYREFGKYAIHIPQLEQQDILNIKYKSLGGIPKFKPVAVSDIFRDFLLDLLEGGKINQRIYLQIEPKERKLFEEIAIGAGVWNSFGLKRTTTSTDEEERKRFDVLKGIYLAGNNSPKVLQELRHLVVKFINEGKIRKSDGMNLLMELSTG